MTKQIPAYIVYEDDYTIAMLDAYPRALGHTMVLPKIHIESILDLPDEKIHLVFAVVKKITGMLKKVFMPDGFTIGINHGKAGGQAVDHLHIHILPRWYSDGGGSLHSVVNNPPKESLEKIQQRITTQ